MSRELRVNPLARSSTAARVRVASEKPKASSRRATASADMMGFATTFGGRVGLRWAGSGRQLDGAERFQQGAEEESLVDGPDLALATAQRVVETGRGRGGRVVLEAKHQSETAPGGGVGGYRVRLFLLDELQPVLHRPQEAVPVTERSSVVGGHVPGSGQLGEGVECRALPDSRVVAAVHQLEELDGELDVADPPRTALDLSPSKAAPGHDPLGSGFHRPHRGQLVRAVMPAPHLLDGGAFEPMAQLGVAGDGARLEQRLEFPRGGPACPVGAVALEGPREWARPTFGPEVGVDPEAQPRRLQDASCRVLVRPIGGDEEDVHVAGVVELASPELSHSDDGDGVPSVGERDGPVEHLSGEVGQRPPYGLQRVEPQKISGRDAKKLESFGSCQGGRVRRVDGDWVVQVVEHVRGSRVHDAEPTEGVARRAHRDEHRRQGRRLGPQHQTLDDLGTFVGHPVQDRRRRLGRGATPGQGC